MDEIRKSFSFTGREFAELFCASGDLFAGVSEAPALKEEARKKLCAAMKKQTAEYASGAALTYRAVSDGIEVKITFDCDGVWKNGEDFVLDYLLPFRTPMPPARDALLEAEALCAAAILCLKRGLNSVTVRKAEYGVYSGKLRFIPRICGAPELKKFLDSAILRAMGLLKAVCPKAGKIKFPYPSLREGQRDLMDACYDAVRHKYALMVCAPTGVGKTLSFLYPALKAVEKGRAKRVFFLTPKGSTQRQIARSVQLLDGDSRFHRSVILFARQSHCVNRSRCLREKCALCAGHEDRILAALISLFEKHSHIDPAACEECARSHSVCPFELSVAAARLCDVIIADYNFVFDPKARLRELADSEGIVLVDEAHNLPDRVCQSLSAELNPALCARIREKFPSPGEKESEILNQLAADFAREANRIENGGESMTLAAPKDMGELCRALYHVLRPLCDPMDGEAVDLLYGLRGFFHAVEDFDRGYVCARDPEGGVKLCLADPSEHIREAAGAFGTGIYFSATLLPEEYFFPALGGTAKDLFLRASSPFDPGNFLICTAPLATNLASRGESLRNLCKIIAAACVKKGRYLAFFPSFEYLNRTKSAIMAFVPNLVTVSQSPSMSPAQRRDFLAFLEKGHETKSVMGLCVLGGLFAEGVELERESVDGVIVVGTGMAPPSMEKEAAVLYYSESGLDGKAYSYALPGFNRVLQAVGRVIRRESDRGFAVLCDKRYADGSFDSLFPSHWNDPLLCPTPAHLRAALNKFYES